MNLYRNIESGKFSGTQALAKAQGPFVPIEVPVDKAGLIAFLNNFETVRSNYVSPARVESHQPDAAPSQGKNGVVRKQIICYLEYNPSIDEVTDVRLVSNEQFAADNFPAWKDLDQKLTHERS